MMVARPNAAPKIPGIVRVRAGDKVANHSNGRDDQPAATDPLQRPKRNEFDHVLREAAQSGAEQKDDDPRLQHDFAAMDISELP